MEDGALYYTWLNAVGLSCRREGLYGISIRIYRKGGVWCTTATYIVLVLYKCNYLCGHVLLLLLYPFCFTNYVLVV